MIWTKTDAGRIEMTARTRVKERAQRNLLLLIDGAKSEEMLLANVVGVTIEDFRALEALGLIAPVSGSGSSRLHAPAAAAPAAAPAAPGVGTPVDPGELDYAKFTATLTQMISSELGLRGFTLTLAVEKASTIEELRDVADRTIEQIRSRKGEPAAHKARRLLYGG
ncbi:MULTISPECIES: hypothetical protein [unclassified Rhizobacter]|uniref:hypothetical protein n=1 Tax=unclassified Rhizobacter TaxID=2640088 RepID=UPI000A8CC781|nr:MULTISPECIES: hypothetical protein [unclassified Rhizobacter]NKI94503.1 hypothetical protein [Rhizobacter sp. SG703]